MAKEKVREGKLSHNPSYPSIYLSIYIYHDANVATIGLSRLQRWSRYELYLYVLILSTWRKRRRN